MNKLQLRLTPTESETLLLMAVRAVEYAPDEIEADKWEQMTTWLRYRHDKFWPSRAGLPFRPARSVRCGHYELNGRRCLLADGHDGKHKPA